MVSVRIGATFSDQATRRLQSKTQKTNTCASKTNKIAKQPSETSKYPLHTRCKAKTLVSRLHCTVKKQQVRVFLPLKGD